MTQRRCSYGASRRTLHTLRPRKSGCVKCWALPRWEQFRVTPILASLWLAVELFDAKGQVLPRWGLPRLVASWALPRRELPMSVPCWALPLWELPVFATFKTLPCREGTVIVIFAGLWRVPRLVLWCVSRGVKNCCRPAIRGRLLVRVQSWPPAGCAASARCIRE